MRQAINENRTVQLVLIGVLALAGALFLLKFSGGGSQSSAAESTSADSSAGVAATAAPVGSTATAATGTTPVGTIPTGTTPVSTGAAGAASATPPVPSELVPGPGLPKSLLAAYKRGDAVALLVIRAGGTDDAVVHRSIDLLNGVGDLAVYSTKAKHIARYSWITQGVDLTDLPALVVLLPRRITKGQPTASVSYGFRDATSVLQAARDALYRGPTDLPYHP